MLFYFIKSQYGGKKALLKYYAHKFMNIFFMKYKNNKKVTGTIDRVVFVCKGNICRSAWAECYFKSISSFPVCSLGLEATTGNLAEKKVMDCAKRRGFDLSGHRTTSLSDFEPKPNDLYVCMEPIHVERLRSVLDLKQNNIVLLGMWYKKPIPYIHDPYSCNIEFTNKCLDVISVAIDNIQLLISEKEGEDNVS